MGRARSFVVGGVIGAVVGVALAPRRGESRREALDRLRLAVRPGRGAVGAFAGTPCAAEERAHGLGGPGAPSGSSGGSPATPEREADG